MQLTKRMTAVLTAVLVFSTLLSAFKVNNPAQYGPGFKMPYKQAGLTDRQAAAHLLNRFTYGATPGQIDEVVKMGLEKWFEKQLEGNLDDDNLKKRLKEYDALDLSNEEVLKIFPRPPRVLQEAIKEGVINKDSVNNLDNGGGNRQQLQEYMKQKGYRSQQELFRQVANQKLLRAAYSKNQLREMLTDFWFNHFNVSVTKNDCAPFIPAYERDVIRPNVAGKFYDMLLATAHSPAMLYYLDNFTSSGKNAKTEQQEGMLERRMEKRMETMDPNSQEAQQMEKRIQRRKEQGLNENYAREIMELHTLGVDGGYTQKDVTEAARVLTGWTVYPMEDGPAGQIRNLINRIGENNLEKAGFVRNGDFLFAMNRHDDSAKTVLGKTFSAGGGYNEGIELIKMLAHHSSTAKFLSKKIAVRFVNDNPPSSLINKMAETFTKSDGDIKEVLKTMVSSSEFWNKDAIREKTKSPFELAVSSIRVLNADVKTPFILYQWITKMGEKYYFYQAPTGFPDKGEYWINTGSLLYRMNFGLAFAAQKIPGVSFNLASLNNNKEPESAEAALKVYSRIIMPERNLDATIKRLTPLINDPDIQRKIDEAAGKNPAQNTGMTENDSMMNGQDDMINNKQKNKNKMEDKLAKQVLKKGNKTGPNDFMPMAEGNNSMLSQVVGIILGSPEFQRR
ncbi:MAG TPA: DUF1800 domain-containing protein [Chitinophagaceae bacterium]|nr:DUF1800 domain-containing protein [Chitinophagaceae bacterium]